jgi:hypothetical protein
MKTSLVLSILLTIIGSTAFAYDSDPGYGQRTVFSGSTSPGKTGKGTYFKPTMRYFGKGYTVAYRYVQWSNSMNRAGTPAFEASQHRLPETALAVTGSGYNQRVVYYSGGQQQYDATRTSAPVTSPVSTVKEIPAIAEKVKP